MTARRLIRPAAGYCYSCVSQSPLQCLRASENISSPSALQAHRRVRSLSTLQSPHSYFHTMIEQRNHRWRREYDRRNIESCKYFASVPTKARTVFTREEERSIDKIADKMLESQNILFVTGAGMSADSGLPTYRGTGGLYNGTATEDGISIEQALSLSCFAKRPDLTWKYLLQIEKHCRGANPNSGHTILAEAEQEFERVWVLTQNIDGLHQKAGSKNLIDIHGSIQELYCVNCGFPSHVDTYESLQGEIPPVCHMCMSGYLRPKVVLFEEQLPTEKLLTLQSETKKGFDMVFSIGTSSMFPYISAPVVHSKGFTVEINPHETDISGAVHCVIRQGAAMVLDEVWNKYQKRK